MVSVCMLGKVADNRGKKRRRRRGIVRVQLSTEIQLFLNPV